MWKYNYTPEPDELYHWGIKGMKWGVRRYQNKDGTLTPAGKKRYDKMSDDKLQKTLYKQVKKARSEQSGSANQWRVDNTIGKHSKAAQEKYKKAYEEHRNSDSVKRAIKEIDKLDDRFNKGQIDAEEYDAQYHIVRDSIYRPDLDRSVSLSSGGRKYVKEYVDSYGKDLNIGYLKDLGYDDNTAKELTDRVLRANKKLLNGM